MVAGVFAVAAGDAVTAADQDTYVLGRLAVRLMRARFLGIRGGLRFVGVDLLDEGPGRKEQAKHPERRLPSLEPAGVALARRLQPSNEDERAIEGNIEPADLRLDPRGGLD